MRWSERAAKDSSPTDQGRVKVGRGNYCYFGDELDTWAMSFYLQLSLLMSLNIPEHLIKKDFNIPYHDIPQAK